MIEPTDILGVLDDDALRDAVTALLKVRTGRTVWFVDEDTRDTRHATRDTRRPCVAGQRDVLCWQFVDGAHVHLAVCPRRPWKGEK